MASFTEGTMEEVVAFLGPRFNSILPILQESKVSTTDLLAADRHALVEWGVSEEDATNFLAALCGTTVTPALEAQLNEFGQMHTLNWLARGFLSYQQAALLVKQLSELDLQRVSDAYASTKKKVREGDQEATSHSDIIEPPDSSSCDSLEDMSSSDRLHFETLGSEEIASGKAAVVILGGGQGTRLGFDGPKGMYDIGLPSGKSLFQLYAERIVRLQQLVSASIGGGKKINIPLYIMTSPLNNEITQGFFKQYGYFGLDSKHVHFFQQGTLPALTDDDAPDGGGKIIMQTGYTIAEAPDGNGGIYNAMEIAGVLSALEEAMVRSVHVFSVDNAICKVADPLFLGYCLSRRADVGNKVVWKRSPEEKVGVVARRGGRTAIVEYSELSEDLAQSTAGDTGKLVFGAGNICNHYFTVPFLRKVVTAYRDEPTIMPYHVARKKIQCADPKSNGSMPPSNRPNGIKLEAFIFDSFPLAVNSAILEVKREEEFSPVKNAPGQGSTDSPDTARCIIMSLHRRWAEENGAKFTIGNSGDADGSGSSPDFALFEISPLVSYAGEGLGGLTSGAVYSPLSDSPVHITQAPRPIDK